MSRLHWDLRADALGLTFGDRVFDRAWYAGDAFGGFVADRTGAWVWTCEHRHGTIERAQACAAVARRRIARELDGRAAK